MVTHTQNLCSVLNPSKVHTHSSEHTHTEHTPGAVGSHLCCGARGSVGGSVPCSTAPHTEKNDSLNLLNFFKVSGCNQFILATFK